MFFVIKLKYQTESVHFRNLNLKFKLLRVLSKCPNIEVNASFLWVSRPSYREATNKFCTFSSARSARKYDFAR